MSQHFAVEFSGIIYGLRFTLTCPICNKFVPLMEYDYNSGLEGAIENSRRFHALAPCDPTVKWAPEQKGYCK